MATYTKYIDKFQKKINPQTEDKKITADKEIYISFLELQLEKVSNALISSKTFDERLEQALTKLTGYDDKFSTMMKLIKLLQGFADSQELENAQIKEKVQITLGDFAKRLSRMEMATNTEELEGKVIKIEKKLEKTQQYFEENIGKIDDQFFLQKNFKEYEKGFENFEKKVNNQIQNITNSLNSDLKTIEDKINVNISMNSQNISFENTKENLLKELQIKIDEKFNIEKNDIKILSDLIEEEKRDRVSSFEKFLMQNYQKEQILNNLTDDLMSKLELVEKIHSETIGNKGLQIEKYNKELKEIKLSISNLNEKIEKSSKIMDKTFSFQDPSISRKDFEEFERKISDNILINFEKTYDRMKNSLMKKKKTSSSPYKENNPPINVRNSLNHQRTVKTSNLSEISPNLPYSTDSELDNVLFERSRKLKHDEKLLLQASEIKNTKDFDSKSPSPNYKSKTPSPNYKLKNKSPSGLKSLQNSSSKYSSLTKSRSITQISGKKSPLFKKKKSRENSKEKIKKTTKRKENISPMKTNTSCSKKKKSPSPTPLENSSFYTKSLKYDYNFSNSNSQSNNKKQRSLLSDKYKKLEKIYESLSKE